MGPSFCSFTFSTSADSCVTLPVITRLRGRFMGPRISMEPAMEECPDLALEIGTNQRIKIEMRELQRDLPRPLPAKVDGAVNIQFGIFKIRAPVQLHVFA